MLGPTGHTDSFTRDRLPASEDWPEIGLAGFDYPDWLNAGVELTDAMVAIVAKIAPVPPAASAIIDPPLENPSTR